MEVTCSLQFSSNLIVMGDFPDSSVGKESTCNRAALVTQLVKNLSEMQENWVQSLGWEDSLKKGKAIHSSILAWRIPWTEEPGELQSVGSQKSWTRLSD